MKEYIIVEDPYYPFMAWVYPIYEWAEEVYR